MDVLILIYLFVKKTDKSEKKWLAAMLAATGGFRKCCSLAGNQRDKTMTDKFMNNLVDENYPYVSYN